MKFHCLTLFILLVFTSCDTKSNRYKVIIDNVEGLQTGSDVLLNDNTIGFVTDMELYGDSVIVYFTLNEGSIIPKDSKFIVQYPMMGISGLHVIPSKRRMAMSFSDTARGFRDTSSFFGGDTANAMKRKEMLRKLVHQVAESIHDGKPESGKQADTVK